MLCHQPIMLLMPIQISLSEYVGLFFNFCIAAKKLSFTRSMARCKSLCLVRFSDQGLGGSLFLIGIWLLHLVLNEFPFAKNSCIFEDCWVQTSEKTVFVCQLHYTPVAFAESCSISICFLPYLHCPVMGGEGDSLKTSPNII